MKPDRSSIIFIIIALFVLFAACGEKDQAEQLPPFDPDNPVLARVGEEYIDLAYFEAALGLLPDSILERYKMPEDFPKLLEEMVFLEVYYQEGKRRNFHRKPQFINLLELAEKKALVDYCKEVTVGQKDQVNDAEAKAYYEANSDQFKGKDDLVASFADVKAEIQDKLSKEKYIAVLDQIYEMKESQYSVNYDFDLLKDKNLDSNKPVVTSGVMTWTYGDFKATARELGMAHHLDSYENRVDTLKRIVRNRVFHDNCLAEKVDMEPAFKHEISIVERVVLSTYTKQKIIGNDIKASDIEARSYYDNHPDLFKNEDGSLSKFSVIRKKVTDIATMEKRNEVSKQLSTALGRDRYKYAIFTEYCEKAWPKVKIKKLYE